MGKYDPLRTYLRRHQADELVLSFSDIERMVGLLPKSAQQPQWWANQAAADRRLVQCHAWLGAKRSAFLVSGQERVVFRKTPLAPLMAD